MDSSGLCLKKRRLNMALLSKNSRSYMKHPLLFALILCASGITLHAETPPLMTQEEPGDLVIYNRILAKVNGKTISVIDVVKKMDLFLQKNYPHLADSKAARYQFFSNQWKDYLIQMIDSELMLVDAERLEVKVTDAEVREEILNRFGPNIMPALDKLGITYEEAKTLIHDELIVQKMIWFRVNSKALIQVNSQDVKTAYKQYLEKNPEMEEWRYQVLSIRSADKTANEIIASKAFDLLQSRMPFEATVEELKKSNDALSITLSPEIEADDKSLSVSHKEVLKTLQPLTYSQPIAQVSRVDNSVVHRIFYLKSHTTKTTPPFQKMAEHLKEELLQEMANKENARYLIKLRERLGYDEKHMLETLPADFQPFALK